jgi:molybdopterin-biosynthesis enzyme MoeA-like protein
VAKAFGAPIDTDPRALAILHKWVKTTGAEMNEVRLRMTRLPKGADLILNKVFRGARLLDRQRETRP